MSSETNINRYQRFLRGETNRNENVAVIRDLLLEASAVGSAESITSLPEQTSYASAFAGAKASATLAEARIGTEARRAGEVAKVIAEAAVEGEVETWFDRIRQEQSLQTWALCQELRKRSFDAGLNDPDGGKVLARLAVEVGHQCVGEEGSPLNYDLLAAAWGQLGNALRIASDLPGAEAALVTAVAHLDRGTGDPIARAQLLSNEASLAGNRLQFASGIACCRQAAALFRRAGDRHGHGRMLIQEAYLQMESGDLEASIRCHDAALESIDPALEPRLVLVVQHNLIGQLDEAGRHEEAWDRLPKARRLIDEGFGQRLDRVRLHWLEGQISANLGNTEHAEACLIAVRDAFVELGVAYDAALAALQLAGVLAPQGRFAEMRQLAEEMLPIFQSRDLHPHAQAALKIFTEAARDETAGAELVREVFRYLEAAQNRPELTFRGRA